MSVRSSEGSCRGWETSPVSMLPGPAWDPWPLPWRELLVLHLPPLFFPLQSEVHSSTSFLGTIRAEILVSGGGAVSLQLCRDLLHFFLSPPSVLLWDWHCRICLCSLLGCIAIPPLRAAVLHTGADAAWEIQRTCWLILFPCRTLWKVLHGTRGGTLVRVRYSRNPKSRPSVLSALSRWEPECPSWAWTEPEDGDWQSEWVAQVCGSLFAAKLLCNPPPKLKAIKSLI